MNAVRVPVDLEALDEATLDELLSFIPTGKVALVLVARQGWQTRLAEVCAERGEWMPAKVVNLTIGGSDGGPKA